MTSIDTGKKLRLIETDDIQKISFAAGQLIIVDDGLMFYDPTIGKSLDDRLCLTSKREIDICERMNGNSDEYYLALHVNPIDGDIIIIKDAIPNSTEFSHTIYMYNSNDEDSNTSNWCKLTASYNAKNIYLNKDIEITLPIESLENKTLNCAGKNIEDALNDIFSPDVYPTIIQPSVNLVFPQGGAYEIGSIVTPNYSMSLNAGNYEFGPDTGVVATTYTAASSNGDIKDTYSGSFSPIIVSKSTDFYMSASITYSNGAVPLTKKRCEYPDGTIKIGYASIESSHITGYVNGLFYGCTSEKNVSNNITSEMIRSLNKSGKEYCAENVQLSIPIDTTAIIIACPTNYTGVTKIYNDTVNCDMTAAFGSPIVVTVNGNNDSIEYAKDFNVWIYEPAEAYSVPTDLTITLS